MHLPACCSRIGFRPLFLGSCAAEMHFRFGQTQFSALIPGMRLNARILLVTTISPSLRA